MAAENKESSFVRQVGVCLSRCRREFINENGWKYIISMGIIMLLISTVTGEDLFKTDKATQNGCFALICACIWTGIFNSIRIVCRERDIIKREHRTGLRMSSYVAAHMIHEGALSLVEALLATIIIRLVNNSHFIKSGVILPPVVELFITFFLVIFAADIFAMMISSVVTNENAAMTAMPFALIVQMIFAGVVFELEGTTEKISYATISRWGMNGLCAIANYNKLTLFSYVKEWESTPENVIKTWLVLLGFAALYGVLSWIALLNVDRY